MSKRQNIKILKQAIAAALNEEDELELLRTEKFYRCINFRPVLLVGDIFSIRN